MTRPDHHQNAIKTDPCVEAYTQYRDTLIQHLFVSKALRFIRQVEDLECFADPGLRARHEARRQCLTDSLAKLQTILAGFRSSPLTDYRKKNTGPLRTGGNGAAAASGAAAWLPTSDDMASTADDWLSSVDYVNPAVNVNGLPMIGVTDIHGNAYGTTTFDGGHGF